MEEIAGSLKELLEKVGEKKRKDRITSLQNMFDAWRRNAKVFIMTHEGTDMQNEDNLHEDVDIERLRAIAESEEVMSYPAIMEEDEEIDDDEEQQHLPQLRLPSQQQQQHLPSLHLPSEQQQHISPGQTQSETCHPQTRKRPQDCANFYVAPFKWKLIRLKIRNALIINDFFIVVNYIIFPAEATRPTAKDSIVAKHGSFYLCTSDMESLNEKGWLTDAVLDAYLHYHLKNKTNIMHVCTQAMTTIFNGEGCHLFNKQFSSRMHTWLIVYFLGHFNGLLPDNLL
ncbi:hypothetical protein CAPTEDRAFT_226068 [Capitella teleta]|uniref:Uncharacterized protein n=1 Tax=Capitella teleta TaxID=283909 RepID=R7UX58_CAPTE|nr:hypothetical protein CAPTEDRAFT_226068 [Capitella teleta]|eukprot:ELU08497.1 hypothetical protein CAPTEDRAFT_226068 [Capitella teleta]